MTLLLSECYVPLRRYSPNTILKCSWIAGHPTRGPYITQLSSIVLACAFSAMLHIGVFSWTVYKDPVIEIKENQIVQDLYRYALFQAQLASCWSISAAEVWHRAMTRLAICAALTQQLYMCWERWNTLSIPPRYRRQTTSLKLCIRPCVQNCTKVA